VRLDGFTELVAIAGREAQASCGCTFVFAKLQGIDHQTGNVATGDSVVLLPCNDDEHLLLARQMGEVEGLDEAVAEFERLLVSTEGGR
jgi:hypothetical protein